MQNGNKKNHKKISVNILVETLNQNKNIMILGFIQIFIRM